MPSPPLYKKVEDRKGMEITLAEIQRAVEFGHMSKEDAERAILEAMKLELVD